VFARPLRPPPSSGTKSTRTVRPHSADSVSSLPHDPPPLVGVQLVRPRPLARSRGSGRSSWTPPTRRQKPAAARRRGKNSHTASSRCRPRSSGWSSTCLTGPALMGAVLHLDRPGQRSCGSSGCDGPQTAQDWSWTLVPSTSTSSTGGRRSVGPARPGAGSRGRRCRRLGTRGNRVERGPDVWVAATRLRQALSVNPLFSGCRGCPRQRR
jgi:hypothetical protein